jgi:hypothetical protein
MAARRLLILMLGVLAVSTLAAALLAPAPEPEPAETTTDRVENPEAPKRRTGTGHLIEAELRTTGGRFKRIRLRPGDQLALTVRSRTGAQVEIPAFGLIEDVHRDDPARFDLLAGRRGTFEVRLVSTGRVIGRVRVGTAHPTGGG